jgi:LysM repeat protein
MILRADRTSSDAAHRSPTASAARRVVSLRAASLCAATLLAAHAASAQAPASAGTRPATHTVKRGDTLWDISKFYLADPFLWPEIYRLNTDQIEDPHWIYPGEVLKLPGATRTVAQAPEPPRPAPEPAVVTPASPTVTPVPAAREPEPQQPQPRREAQVPTVRMGEYVAAPWVDIQGGPKGAGYIIGARDIPGIASADHSRMGLFDAVNIAPPVGSVAAEHERFLTYVLGPDIEEFGQIVIPTGVVEITRSPRNGEAAIGRVVKMFGEMLQGQRLIPLDSAAAVLTAQPAPVANGKTGKVRWVKNSPVLPSLQNYLIVDISRRDVTAGDQIDLYLPRQEPVEGRDLALPETWIARAQILRVTPYGASAIITSQQQPAISEGTAARVAAKMP